MPRRWMGRGSGAGGGARRPSGFSALGTHERDCRRQRRGHPRRGEGARCSASPSGVEQVWWRTGDEEILGSANDETMTGSGPELQ
jgi:hypothetical protein